MIRLKNFKNISSFKKVALHSLVKMMSNKDMKSLTDVFEAIDKDNSGVIELEELK
jgi:Ca2+-binding EF-hand superfamily protein